MTTADEGHEAHEFTEQELEFIFGMCSGLPVIAIAAQHKMNEEVVRHIIYEGAFEKAGVSTRVGLFEFAKTALNAELRRRRTGGVS